MKLTQIQVTKETRRKLKYLKIFRKESYDELINRLLFKKEVKKDELRNM